MRGPLHAVGGRRTCTCPARARAARAGLTRNTRFQSLAPHQTPRASHSGASPGLYMRRSDCHICCPYLRPARARRGGIVLHRKTADGLLTLRGCALRRRSPTCQDGEVVEFATTAEERACGGQAWPSAFLGGYVATLRNGTCRHVVHARKDWRWRSSSDVAQVDAHRRDAVRVRDSRRLIQSSS